MIYEVCPERIQPFWISREPVAWPWCNLAASQRRPYCASVNSQSPVGLVSRQWDAVDWDCVPSHWQWPSEQISFTTTRRLPNVQLSCRLFWQSITFTQVCQPPYSLDLAPCEFWLFPKIKSPLKGWRFVNATVTQYTSSVNGVSLPTD